MTKRFSWEVDKTSLILRVVDGPKTMEYKINKSTKLELTAEALAELSLAISTSDHKIINLGPQTLTTRWDEVNPMYESVRTVDAEELAELQGYPALQADSEEASRAAQAAQVAKLSIGAKWFDVDEDESYGVDIPSFDDGEVKPR